MAYRTTSREHHDGLASGLVTHSAPGLPAYLVRLAEELFLRAADHAPGVVSKCARLTVVAGCTRLND